MLCGDVEDCRVRINKSTSGSQKPQPGRAELDLREHDFTCTNTPI